MILRPGEERQRSTGGRALDALCMSAVDGPRGSKFVFPD